MASDNQLIALKDKSFRGRYASTRAVATLKLSQELEFFESVRRNSVQLQRCDPESLKQAFLQASAMGLSFNPIMSLCYLIPYRARGKKSGESDADFDRNVPVLAYASPSYRGLIHIGVRGRAILYARAEVVFKGDIFKYRGPMEPVEYQMNTQSRGEQSATGVFAMAKLPNGDIISEYMDRSTVLRIRSLSKMPNSLLWKPDGMWTEGWKKADLRRLMKSITPLSEVASFQQAVHVLNEHEGLADRATGTDREPETPIEVLISESQHTQLHALLADAGVNEPDRQLGRLAKSMGFDKIMDVPAAKFDDAMAHARHYLSAMKDRHAAGA